MPNTPISTVSELQDALGTNFTNYKGAYSTIAILEQTFTLGTDGDFAVVKETGTFFYWDDINLVWVNTGEKATENYYTKTEIDSKLANVGINNKITFKTADAQLDLTETNIVFITSNQDLNCTFIQINSNHNGTIINITNEIASENHTVNIILPDDFTFSDTLQNNLLLNVGERVQLYINYSKGVFISNF